MQNVVVNGLPLDRLIRALDEAGAVGLAHALLNAERGRLGLPADSVEWGFRVKVSDGGVDGRTRFPSAATSPYPLGQRLWQVKSGSSTPDPIREFAPPRRKPPGTEKWVVEQLRSGDWGYVLFWTHDPVDPERARLYESFNKRLDEIATTIPRDYILLDQIVELCRHHPQTALPLLGVPTLGALSVDQWGALFRGDFVTNTRREVAMGRLRAFASSSDPSVTLMRVYGDSGAGKSRLVYEAVSSEELRDRTLVAVGTANAALPSWVQGDPEASLVLVLDDATPNDIRVLRPIAAAAAGRLRVIAIEQGTVGDVPDDLNIEVEPLERAEIENVMRPLVPEGVSFEAVANLAGGYPDLAMELARALREPTVGEELATLARRREIGEILRRMIPDDHGRGTLAAIAPFTRIGVDGDAGEDFEILCDELGLDRLSTAAMIERFVPRFVARSGRYRRITPGLLAIWLFEEAVHLYGMRLVAAATKMSGAAVGALLHRMSESTGSADIRRYGDELSKQPRFSGDRLSSLTLEGAQLLSTLGVIAPDVAANRIADLVDGASSEELVASKLVRRDLVWALEEALWHEPAFERAATSLFALATNEIETVGNNASGVFTQAYQVYLAGTPVPYGRRLAVARSLLEGTDVAGRRLIVAALGEAFDFHYSRTESHRGRVTGHGDWMPSREEARQARVEAWGLLAEIARTYPDVQEEVGREIAQSIRAAIAFGLGSLVDEATRAGAWDPLTRAKIVHELRLALDFGQIPDEDIERTTALVEHLEGYDFADRLEVALAGEPHEVARLGQLGAKSRPDVLDVLVRDLIEDARRVSIAVDAAGRGVPLTVQILFRRYGEVAPDSSAYADIAPRLPSSAQAAMGFLSGRDAAGDKTWVDERLEEWSRDAMNAWLPSAVRSLAASDRRAILAIESVEDGAAPALDLSLLMYGSWAETLSEPVVVRLARALVAGDARVIEHAIGIVEQWLSTEGNVPSDDLRSVTLSLVDQTLDLERDATLMTSLLRSRVVHRLHLQASELEPRVAALVSRSGHLDEYDLALVDHYLAADSEYAANAMVRLVVDAIASDDPPLWVFRVDDARLLSRVAAAADVMSVAGLIVDRARDRLPRVLDHVAVRGTADGLDPLFAALLIPRVDDEEFRRAAAEEFVHEERAFWGLYSRKLEERQAEAARLSEGHPNEAIRRWATWILGLLEAPIEEARQREAEEDERI